MLNQTYQQFELIIVDDGSVDRSRDIIQQYQSEYPDKIKAIFKENGGQGSAFNIGFEVATGEIIAFLDADDYWYENKLEIIMNHHQVHDGVQHNLLINNKTKYTFFDDLVIKQQSALKEFGFLGIIPTSGLSFSKKSLNRIFPIPQKDFKICADLYVRNMYLLDNEILSIDYPLGVYRVHDSNHWYSDKSIVTPLNHIILVALNNRQQQLGKGNIPYESNGVSFSNYLYSTLDIEKDKRYIIYGTGTMGRMFYNKIKKDSKVIGFASTHNEIEHCCDLPVFMGEVLYRQLNNWDKIIVASEHMVEIVHHLIENNIPVEKIVYPKI